MGVALTALAAVWPSRSGTFLAGDDEWLILNHYLVNHPTLENAWKLISEIPDDLYQPVAMISFQIDCLRSRPDPTGRFPIEATAFRNTNLLLHACNAVLVFFLVSRWASCARVGLTTALLFACHPFCVESTCWINGRMILLASTLALVVLQFAPQGLAAGRHFVLLPITYALSLASKVIPTLPIVGALITYDRQGRITRRCWALYALLMMVGLGFSVAAVRSTAMYIDLDEAAVGSLATVPPRAMIAFSYYLENYFWPSRLTAWVPPAEEIGWRSATLWRAIGECAVLVGVMWFSRKRSPRVFLGIVIFCLLLLPFLAAGMTRHLGAADRYMYLPVMGLHVAIATCAVAAVDRLRGKLGAATARLIVGLPLLAALAGLIRWSAYLSGTMTNTVSRHLRMVEVYPDNPEVGAMLAKAYLFDGKTDEAGQVLEAARARWPDNARVAIASGQAYRAMKDWPAAERELRRALDQLPNHLRTRYLLGLTLEDLGRRAEAQEQYRTLIGLDKGFLPAITALARTELSAGNANEAMRLSEDALRINPNNVESLRRLSGILMSRGQDDRALPLLERAAELDPSDLTAMAWLHILLVEQGRQADAVSMWLKARARFSDDAPMHGWLALAVSTNPSETLPIHWTDALDAWANAIRALTLRNDNRLREVVSLGMLNRPFTGLVDEKRRAIVSTIGHLPDEIRSSPAAVYLVAQAFINARDLAAAARIAEGLAGDSAGGYWAENARRLLNEARAGPQLRPH